MRRLQGRTVELQQRLHEAQAARDAAQALALQAVRRQALGQLSGGIAHDLNNVLQTVASGAALLNRLAHNPQQVQRTAAMVADAARRGAAITQRLLAFAREDDAWQAQALAPRALLEDLCELLAHTLGPAYECRIEADAALPPLQADRRQLEAALVNLATNARDAMPQGGVITVQAEAEAVEGDGAPAHRAALAPGRYVRLAVADQGCGMPPEVLARALEPFFTTKPPGQGTGLGLALAHDCARQCGGGIAIDSAPGQGTVVTLWLPQAQAQAQADAGPGTGQGGGAPPPQPA